MALALIFIIAIILIKYKPVYKVNIAGKCVGYIENKLQFEEQIEEFVNVDNDKSVAFVTINEMPEYEFKLVKNTEKTNEEEILGSIEESAIKTYTMYAIVLNDDIKAYVDTEEEAEEVVNKLKEQYENELELNIGIRHIYSEVKEETIEKDIAIAKLKNENIEKLVEEKKEEEIKKGATVVNGITLATKPVTGIITSRFGVSSRIRSGDHTGLDIAASSGTPILACCDGIVTFAARNGSYGNLVKISHGSGVETWYAHCSKIYVSVGQKISAGDKIAAVGSTGNSTGPHLHLEVRINGTAVNPQNYLYK